MRFEAMMVWFCGFIDVVWGAIFGLQTDQPQRFRL